MSQGIFQQEDPSLMTREINNAFSAAADANSIYPNTVWGLNFANEYVRDAQNGAKVLKWIKDNKSRAKKMGLKVGTRVDTCDQIYGGKVQNVLIQIAKESDFIMCNLYPPQGANNIDQAIQLISNSYYSSRDGFWRYNNKLEVMTGETGWASQGDTFNGAVNTVDNEKRFWEGMRNWAQSNKVKVQMFEAFDEPWKSGRQGEKHFG
jgi:exo-beta-1,3-glucanase (GH17 family)